MFLVPHENDKTVLLFVAKMDIFCELGADQLVDGLLQLPLILRISLTLMFLVIAFWVVTSSTKYGEILRHRYHWVRLVFPNAIIVFPSYPRRCRLPIISLLRIGLTALSLWGAWYWMVILSYSRLILFATEQILSEFLNDGVWVQNSKSNLFGLLQM